jgi:hypothetical protein
LDFNWRESVGGKLKNWFRLKQPIITESRKTEASNCLFASFSFWDEVTRIAGIDPDSRVKSY